MESQKAAVLHYLKTDRSLLGARNLYNQFPDKNRALQNSFSRMIDSEANRQVVYYELAKHVGIDQRALTIVLNQPLGKAAEAKAPEKEPAPPAELTPQDKLLAFFASATSYHEAKAMVRYLGIPVADQKKDTIFAALEGARGALVASMVKELPAEVKASIKLRDQFPFLREANCPDSLKILVNDLISTYEAFQKAQPKLHELLSEQDGKATAEIVLENYIANKEAYQELEHYKETGEILGQHPLFERLAAKEEISNLSTTDLVSKIKNLGINIGKNRKKGNDELVARDEELLAHAEAVLKNR